MLIILSIPIIEFDKNEIRRRYQWNFVRHFSLIAWRECFKIDSRVGFLETFVILPSAVARMHSFPYIWISSPKSHERGRESRRVHANILSLRPAEFLIKPEQCWSLSLKERVSDKTRVCGMHQKCTWDIRTNHCPAPVLYINLHVASIISDEFKFIHRWKEKQNGGGGERKKSEQRIVARETKYRSLRGEEKDEIVALIREMRG